MFRKNIGLYITIDDAYTRGIARGIIKYAKNKNDWNLLGYDWMFSSGLELSSNLDGIITRIESKELLYKLHELGIPVIDVAGAYTGMGFFEVNNDDYVTGLNAGYYLSGLGHSNFAWAGVSGVQWSKYRFAGYHQNIENISVFEKSLSWWEKLDFETELLFEWLNSLQKPTALFAANDTVGLKIIKVCRTAENPISIPNDIAVLGVDNEDILCELANPTLSSVGLNCEQIGFTAAEQLDLIMNGRNTQKLENKMVLPLDIIERESSRILVTEDEIVSNTLNFIMNSAHTKITVDDILKIIPASRRNLEQRFKKITGKTLHEAIVIAKIQHSKKLMRTTDVPLNIISEQSGFGSLQRFHEEFKKSEKMTPTQWKKQNC